MHKMLHRFTQSTFIYIDSESVLSCTQLKMSSFLINDIDTLLISTDRMQSEFIVMASDNATQVFTLFIESSKMLQSMQLTLMAKCLSVASKWMRS